MLIDVGLVATRLPNDYARSIRRIAELRRTTVSAVVARIVCEQVAPIPADTDENTPQAA